MKKTLIAIMLSTSLIGGIGASIGSQTAEASTLKAEKGICTSIIKDNVKDSEVLNLTSDCGIYQRRLVFKKYFGCINGQAINTNKPILNGGIIIGNGNNCNTGNDNNTNTSNKDEINNEETNNNTNNNINNNINNNNIGLGENGDIVIPPVQNEKPNEDISIDKVPDLDENPSIDETPSVDKAPVIDETPSIDNNTNSGVVNDQFMAEVEKLIYEKVNEERAKAGLATLSYNTIMEKYARIKSQDMGDNNYFSHEDLNGNLITTQMKNDGVTYKAWGENIAYIGGVSDAAKLAEQFMTNWMNSPGHKANILSTNFSSIGVGVYKIGNKVYATQEFYR
ncbi:MAG: CAP domain-containing protein [Clostridium sp.]|nr:CAP domain-containing protein [Clostridium sp.]